MCKGPEAESAEGPGVTEEGWNVVSQKGAWYKGQAGVRPHDYSKEFGFHFTGRKPLSILKQGTERIDL